MKNFLLLSLLVALVKFGIAQCVPPAPTGFPGFCPPASDFACIERGVPFYNAAIFENFNTLHGIEVNSLHFDSITNLPSGITYNFNPANGTLPGGGTACIEFAGTTNDTVGTYRLGIYVTMNITAIGNVDGELGEIIDNLIILGIMDSATFYGYFDFYLRVVDPGASCPTSGTCSADRNLASGRVFFDINGNGISDGQDVPMQGMRVEIAPISAARYTNDSGYYYALLDSGTYSVSVVAPTYYSVSSPVASYNVVFNGTNLTSLNNDFGLTPNTIINDVSISLTSGIARPGFFTSHWIDYTNVSTTLQSGTVSYTHNPVLSVQSTTEPASTQSGNVLTWNFSNLYPGQQRSIYVMLQVPFDTNLLGDTLNSFASIAIAATDTNQSDNSDTTMQIVSGSYDPNDKQVSPDDVKNGINPNQRLTYTVRFQNTGSDTAFTVVIRDTLDPNLNTSSFQTVASSHPCHFALEGNRYAVWTFNNILLPDSGTNEPQSHGFVKYSIRFKNNTPDQTMVSNSASIYFDFNDPVKTNTVQSRVDFNSGIREQELIASSLFPNPSSGAFTLTLSRSVADFEVEILDISGKLVQRYTRFSGNKAVLDVKGLQDGIYFYRVVNEAVTLSKGKLVLMK